MSYNDLRHFADSYALAVMLVIYLGLVSWVFLPGSRSRNHNAATMIFADDGEGTAENGDEDHG